MLTKASILAATFHAPQFRKHVGKNKTKIPYVFHVIEVAKTLWNWGVDDEVVLTAAVSHDLVEDTPMTAARIARRFGPDVATIVCELTFLPTTKERDARAEEKAHYMETFRTKSVEALVIKLSDRFCNTADKLRSMNNSDNAKSYFAKADCLIDAWRKRQDEIVNRFGQSVQDQIQKQYDLLLIALN